MKKESTSLSDGDWGSGTVYPSMSRKSLKERCFVFFLFALSTVIRGLILPGVHILTTYYDELLYWGIARTFWSAPAFTLYQMPIKFSKFIYPMVLSPLFLIKDAVLRAKLAGWLNASMISFSVFPACRLAKKLTSSKTVRYICLVLFLCSPIMNYGEKYAPECLYLPLSLYLMLFYFMLYQKIEDSASCSMGKLALTAGLSGVFAYGVYLEKEAAVAFTGGFLFFTMIASVRVEAALKKRYLITAFVHALSVAMSHIIVTQLLQTEYSYTMQIDFSNVDSLFKIEFLIHCIISNGLYVCITFFGFPVLYWQIRKNRGGICKHEDIAKRNWIGFLYISFALTLFFHSFSITLVEELGRSSIRLHTRYYIPFLFPLMVLVEDEIKGTEQHNSRLDIRGVLLAGVASVLLLGPTRYVSAYDSYDSWHLRNPVSFFDRLAGEVSEETAGSESILSFVANQTGGQNEITYHHGLLFVMAVATLCMVVVIVLTHRNRKAAGIVLFCLILTTEIYNNVESINSIDRFSSVSDRIAQEYGELDRDIQAVVNGEDLLFLIPERLETEKRRAETFFSFDYYSVLYKDLCKVMRNDGSVDFREVELPFAIKQFAVSSNYPKGTRFSYVLCSDDVKLHETCVKKILHSDVTGFSLYSLKDSYYMDIDYIEDIYSDQ